MSEIIKLLEERICLWDIFHKHYTKIEIKEKSFSDLAEQFYTNIDNIKTKINRLREQLGRELVKEAKTKSG